MNRRDLLKAALLALVPRPAFAASVSTLIGNGSPGFSDSQVNNPYGLVIARDGGLYFCDLDNQWDPLESTCRHASLSIL